MSGINILVSKDADLGSEVTAADIPADCQMMMLAYSAHRNLTMGFFDRYASAQQKAVEASGHLFNTNQFQFLFEVLKDEMTNSGFNLGEKEAQAGKMAVIPFSVVDNKPFALVPVQAVDFREGDLPEDADAANTAYRDALVPVYERLLSTAYHQARAYNKKAFCRFGLLSTGSFAGKIDNEAAVVFSANALAQAIENMPNDFAAHVLMQLVHRAEALDAEASAAIERANPGAPVPTDTMMPGQANPDVFAPLASSHATALAAHYKARSESGLAFWRKWTMGHKVFASALSVELGEESSLHGDADALGTAITSELAVNRSGHCYVLREAARFCHLTTNQPIVLGRSAAGDSAPMAGAGSSAGEQKRDDVELDLTELAAAPVSPTTQPRVATPVPTASATSSATAAASASITHSSLLELRTVGEEAAPGSAPTHRRRVSSFEPVEPAFASVPVKPRRLSKGAEGSSTPSPVTYASVAAGNSPSAVTVVADTVQNLAKRHTEAVTGADV